MNSIQQDIVNAGIIASMFLASFIVAEIWRYLFKPSTETTRKFVHLTCGLITLSFGYVFNSYWPVVFLCVSFVLIMLLTKKLGILKSVHNVERKSQGDIYHPIAICITFIITYYLQMPIFYFIAILILSVSDALAAIIGKTYGFKVYLVQTENKSVEGSIIFFLATFLIVHLSLMFGTSVAKLDGVLISILIAILVTLFESISFGGLDNLIIPISTVFVLAKNLNKSADEMLVQFVILALIILSITIIIKPAKKIGASGIIGISLFAYATWSMLDFYWFIPVLLGVILLSWTDIIINDINSTEKDMPRIRSVFYALIVPFIWVLTANLKIIFYGEKYSFIFAIPFLVSLLSFIAIFWRKGLEEEPALNHKFKQYAIFRYSVLVLVFGFTLFLINPHFNFIYGLICLFLGIMLCDMVYCLLRSLIKNKLSSIITLRFIALTVTVNSIFIYILARLIYV